MDFAVPTMKKTHTKLPATASATFSSELNWRQGTCALAHPQQLIMTHNHYHMTKYGLPANDKTNFGFPANHKTNCGLPTNHKTNYRHLPITQQIMDFPQTARQIMDLHQHKLWASTNHITDYRPPINHARNYVPATSQLKVWHIHLLPNSLQNYDQSTSYQTMTNPPPTKLQNYKPSTSYQTTKL